MLKGVLTHRAQILDLGQVAPRAFEQWSAFASNHVFRASFFSSESHGFRGRMEAHRVGDAKFLFIRSRPYGADRTSSDVAIARGAVGAAPIWILFCTRMPVRIIHCQRDASLEPGDMMIVHGHMPYYRFESEMDMVALVLPAAAGAEWLGELTALAGCAIRPNTLWASLLAANLLALHPRLLESTSLQEEGRSLALHFLSLSVGLLRERSPRAEDSQDGAVARAIGGVLLRDAMVLWLERHYAEAELDARQLAQAFGVSLRHLHQVFSGFGSRRSFLQTLRDIRLRHAISALQATREVPGSGTIAEIASMCGYPDASTFRRVFKQRMGLSPSSFLRDGR